MTRFSVGMFFFLPQSLCVIVQFPDLVQSLGSILTHSTFLQLLQLLCRFPVQILVKFCWWKLFVYLNMFPSTLYLLKGILRRKLSIFWKRAHIKNYEFLKWNNWKKVFFLFPVAYTFYFCKNINPCLYILFSVDKSMM